jgi:putative MATE family efflux protein
VYKKTLSEQTSKDKSNTETKGVKTLLGDPKKAIIKLAVPMIIAMFIQTLYNFVDALWVSGFGADLFTSIQIPTTGKSALAAVGFVLPVYMILIAVSTGIGLGAGSAISRKIGANDKKSADNVAIHAIILSIIIAIIFTIILYYSSNIIYVWMGAGESWELAVIYSKIVFAGSIIVFFTNIAYSILRAEGDAKRTMYAIIIGAIANIVLDPIFIYSFRLGIAGAAYATVLSLILTSIILMYWMFFKKDTYIKFKFRDFKFKKEIIKDIFDVGLPASFQQLSMSITMILINYIIVNVAYAGDNGVAVYSTGWRVVQMAILPMLGLATAIVSVTGFTYGSREYKKLNSAFIYSIKFGLVIEVIIAILTFLLAPFITSIFTTGEGSAAIISDLVTFLQIVCLFYPGTAIGIASSSLFQGIGKGLYSLITTLFRTVTLTPVLAIVFCCLFNTGLVGIWWAIVVANLVGSLVSFIWAKIYVYNLIKHKTIASTMY